jgi:hypothetical protein
MKSLCRAWDQFWFCRVDPISASVFRIFLGGLLTLFYLANSSNWERYYSPDGVSSATILGPTRAQSWSNVFAWTEGLVPLGNFWWLGLGCAICFTIGLNTRLSTIALFLLQASMVHACRMVTNGEDLVFRMLLFYGMFAPLNKTLAVDAWLERKFRKTPRTAAPMIWPLRLMQLNIVLVYVISLPNKLADDICWWDGTAIYWTMMNRTWCRHPGWLIFAEWPVSALMTYGTILVEGLFPILVWFPRTRLLSLAAIASMHLGIALVLQHVTFFTLSMVCSFWVFVPPETTRRLGTALRGAAARPTQFSRSVLLPLPELSDAPPAVLDGAQAASLPQGDLGGRSRGGS